MNRGVDAKCRNAECQRPVDSKGLCTMHYDKARRPRVLHADLPPIEPIDPAEEWRPIPGFEECYRISSFGRVESIRRAGARGGLVAVRIGTDGYPTVSLVQQCKRTRRTVHVLVAAAFLGPRPPGMEVRHLDGNPTNCTVANLAYGTHSENMHDGVRHGTHHGARKTHCPKGHPYDEENTRFYQGRRNCKACQRERW